MSMFQILVGVFFDLDKIEKYDGIFVFYLNVDVFFLVENIFFFFKVNKISYDGINCYVVNYIFLIEKLE